MAEFTENVPAIKNALRDICIAALYEAAGTVQAQTIRNSRTDTGQTKSSYGYHVDEDMLTVTIGSPLENAVWEEFGTGQFALEGKGRKGGWVYRDKNGKYYHTYGKKPNRPLFRAMQQKQNSLQKALQHHLKGMK